jgi:hypothetical protein
MKKEPKPKYYLGGPDPVLLALFGVSHMSVATHQKKTGYVRVPDSLMILLGLAPE